MDGLIYLSRFIKHSRVNQIYQNGTITPFYHTNHYHEAPNQSPNQSILQVSKVAIRDTPAHCHCNLYFLRAKLRHDPIIADRQLLMAGKFRVDWFMGVLVLWGFLWDDRIRPQRWRCRVLA